MKYTGEMETDSVSNYGSPSNSQIFNTGNYRQKLPHDKPVFNEINYSLTVEGGKSFFQYLKSFDLSKEQAIIIIPPNQHYFYDENDFKSVRTLLNLKKLNLIKDIDSFLQNLANILSSDTNFIGCFSENKSNTKNSLISALTDRINRFLDSRTDHNLNKKYVTGLLEKHGFKIINMTEMHGLTFFYSQNNLPAA
jgi:hypothetical protein